MAERGADLPYGRFRMSVWRRTSSVAGRDDAGLQGVLGRVGRVARDHGAFVECFLALIAVVDAAVTAAAEDDGALLPHRAVSARKCTVPQCREAAGLRVAALDGEPRRPVVLEYRRDELAGEGSLIRVPRLVASGVEGVLEICLDPRPGPGTPAEPAARTEVDGVHGAGAVSSPGCLAVPVVEAASAVDVRAAGHH